MTSNLGTKAQDGTHWQCDIYGYEYDMAIYFKLQLGDNPITDYTGYEVGAFVGNECRGVGEIQSVLGSDGNNVQFGYIRIRSNQIEGETVNFRLFESSTNKTFYSTETVSFKNLDLKGLPSSPIVISMLDLDVKDVDGDGDVDDTDIAFNLEKERQKNLADELGQDSDSEASKQLIETAKQAIDDYAYDKTKTIDENKTSLHEIVTQLESSLEAQRKSDFDDYKTGQKTAADDLLIDGDSDGSKQIVADAKSAIDSVTYDKNKTLEENRAIVDAIINKLKNDLASKRAEETADKAALEDYKTAQKTVADNLQQDGDSEASKKLIADTKVAIDAVSYNNNKTLEENKTVVDAIVDKLKEDLSQQRNFEKNIEVSTFTGIYDENLHGITVTVPEGASVKYGDSEGNCLLDNSPLYKDAGTYMVYYEVFKEGLFSFQGNAKVVIEKAQLTELTLEETELFYDTFGKQPQTVKINSVKAGNLNVPADAYTIEGDTETEVGHYTVKVTANANSNFKGVVTADFVIVEKEISIDEQGNEYGDQEKVFQLIVKVLDKETKTLSIEKMNVLNDVTTITIPSEIRGYDVVKIADGVLGDKLQITDVYMPDTKVAISIGKNALPATANIHTPLHLLDDYALMASLKSNYEAVRISAVTMPKNKFWTISCGVDIILPDWITPYICKSHQNDGVIIHELKERIIKANNGVLIASNDGFVGNAFEIIAKPSIERPSGMTPPIGNANNYEGNELCPVIEEQHYSPSEWYILSNNEFHELEPGDNSKVPSCKAILPRKSSAQARTLSIVNSDGSTTEINSVNLMFDDSSSNWYDLQGRCLDGRPTKAGIYLNNGRKVVVK